MTLDKLHVMEWHNGDKAPSPLSEQEMRRRQDDVLCKRPVSLLCHG